MCSSVARRATNHEHELEFGLRRDVAKRLRDLTLTECAAAVGAQDWPSFARQAATLPFVPLANRLGHQLAQFDEEVAQDGLAGAARQLLTRLYVEQSMELSTPLPLHGPLLVVANHPGVYDSMALFGALPRPDLRLLVAEREFLRTMTNFSRSMLFVNDRELPNAPTSAGMSATSSARNRGRGLRTALAHLRQGGALLHFGAGSIEPDPAFDATPRVIGSWQLGTGSLALSTLRNQGTVLVAVVSGVHSARVKHSALVRAAEARGVATIAGLLQVALARWAPVSLRIRVSAPITDLGENAEAATRSLETVARRIARSGG
jgi:hypothetical protein